MKPSKEVDAEGYPRPLADDGVAPAPLPTSSGLNGADEGMRWSTKEWVAGVEKLYWDGMPPSAQGRTDEANTLASEISVGELKATFKKVESDILSQGGLTHEQAAW